MAGGLFDDIPNEDGSGGSSEIDDLFADIPEVKGRPGLRAALRDLKAQDEKTKALRRGRGGDERLVQDRFFNSATLGAVRQVEALLTPRGKGAKYTRKDMYDAVRLYRNAQQQELAGRKPLVAMTADVGGALVMPGAKQVAKFVVGSKAPRLAAAGSKIPAATRVAQGARMAGTGALMTGTTAGALAAPGEETQKAQEGAVTGAILTPVLGGALAAAPPVARTVTRSVARMFGRGPTAEATAIEKLQKALQQAGATPDIIDQASDQLTRLGGIDPAFIDILKKGGASSEVLTLLGKSASRAPQRQAAATFADEATRVSEDRAALAPEERNVDEIARAREAEIARRGQTKATTVERRGEKTQAQLERDEAVRLGQIDQAEADRLAQIESDRIAATPEVPAAPLPREKGAAAFSDDLNRQYDISEKAYKDAYAAAEAARPELATVDEAEVRPLFETFRKTFAGFNPRLKGVGAVSRELEILKQKIAPGELDDWPEGEVMENAVPLTIQDLEFLRQKLVEIADDFPGNAGGKMATRLKGVVDEQLTRLAAENKIVGDPAVVGKWTEAIMGYADHFKKFGQGIPAKLTARNADGSRVVPAYQAGDVIFGASPSQTSLNKTWTDLGDSLTLVSPQSLRALQEELYGRVKPEDLAKLRETTGGKVLLPQDLSVDAIAAREAAAAAEAQAKAATGATQDTAKALREAEIRGAKAQREGAAAVTEARQTQVDLNTAAKQQRLVKEVEVARAPATALADARVAQAKAQAGTARELQRVVEGKSAKETEPALEKAGGTLAYVSGRVNAAIDLLRSGRHLNDAEYTEALKVLMSKDPATRARLTQDLIKRYPAAKRALAPFVVRPVAQSGDPSAVETLEEDYEVTP